MPDRVGRAKTRREATQAFREVAPTISAVAFSDLLVLSLYPNFRNNLAHFVGDTQNHAVSVGISCKLSRDLFCAGQNCFDIISMKF